MSWPHSRILAFFFVFLLLLMFSACSSLTEEMDDSGTTDDSIQDNGDGTVNDLNTGLMWQQATSDSGMDWDSAGSYCSGLSLAGYSDWRLPTTYELQSIVDYGKSDPSIYTTAFPGTEPSFYWSSTTFVSNSSGAWFVSFSNGYVSSYGSKSDSNYVRCVRGNSSVSSFTNNGDGTVTDQKTRLVWQQATADQRDWQAALTYCEGLTLASQSDWRLPNIKELGSIVDRSSSPAIDTTAFPGTESSAAYSVYYWSSTTLVYDAGGAWAVSFDRGHVDLGSKSSNAYVRCVRGKN